MNLIERLDEARRRWNVLDHPFYRRWECGELTRSELVFYAIESGQPAVSRTKLDGLVAHYGFDHGSAATAYFSLHAERDHEHAAASRAVLEEVDPADDDRLVAAAEAALEGNWRLLDDCG